MKKKIIFLFPFKFTNFEYFKFEIKDFKRKFNVKILDLSFANKKFRKVWKSRSNIFAKAPKNFLELKKISKIFNDNPVVINLLENELNLWTLYIRLIIKKNGLKEIILRDSAFDLHPPKKNLSWFFNRISEHGFNFKVYNFYIINYIFKFFLIFFSIKDKFILTTSNKDSKYIHNYDFSNSINSKKKKLNFKYVLYIDNGSPYFSGDTKHLGNSLPNYNLKKIYTDKIIFFRKVERDFNCKVIIIPHPKYKSSVPKIKSYNPYFKDFIVNNHPDAISSLASKSEFILSKGSTASAYAAIFKKPIVFFYSSDRVYERKELENIKEHASDLGLLSYDIVNYSKKNFKKYLKFNRLKYHRYIKKNLCTSKKFREIKNSDLIISFLENELCQKYS